MDKTKVDMSGTCDFKCEEYWIMANHNHTMSQDDWIKWYYEHCGKCIYMCEVCMYGEE